MAFVVPVSVQSLPAALQRTTKAVMGAIQKGAYLGGRRGVELLKSRTPVDRGQMRAAWDISKPAVTTALGELVRIVNDHPMIGVIERGARPHSVSNEGVRAIWEWVWRHRANFNLVTKSGKAAGGLAVQKATLDIAWAIVRKIRREGAKPRYFVRDSMAEVQQFIIMAVVAETARGLK